MREVTAANVGRLARRREPENWEFRAYLKGCGMEQGKMDALVHELYRRASAEFDCRDCANCCKSVSPLLDSEDIERLAEGMSITADRVIADFLVENKEYGGWSFRKMPCPLLKDNLCSRYEHRPHDCASYPHLHKDRFTGRLSNTIANCSVCPIVYTVVERLKDAVGAPGTM